MRTRLIIDNNTVYEIDEDCMEDLRRQKTENNNRHGVRNDGTDYGKNKMDSCRSGPGNNFSGNL